jgi:hypothetical protein
MRSYRPAFDVLEARDTPSIANLTNGVLTVVGTAEANDLKVWLIGAEIYVGDGATLVGKVPAASVNRVVVDAGLGNDRVTVGVAKQSFIYGGKGNDVLLGGSAKDQIYGGDGFDVLKGRGGNDTLWGGALTDALVGGGGANTLLQDSPSRTYDMNTVENEIVARVNQQRENAGLPALTINVNLAFAAQFRTRPPPCSTIWPASTSPPSPAGSTTPATTSGPPSARTSPSASSPPPRSCRPG